MTVYALPPEPEGPLWDRDGKRWVRNETGGYETGGWHGSPPWHELLWHELLYRWGPLTDVSPELPLGEVRWDHSHPRLFVVRGLDRDGSPCWRGGHGSEIPDDIVERYYIRTEPVDGDDL